MAIPPLFFPPLSSPGDKGTNNFPPSLFFSPPGVHSTDEEVLSPLLSRTGSIRAVNSSLLPLPRKGRSSGLPYFYRRTDRFERYPLPFLPTTEKIFPSFLLAKESTRGKIAPFFPGDEAGTATLFLPLTRGGRFDPFSRRSAPLSLRAGSGNLALPWQRKGRLSLLAQ